MGHAMVRYVSRIGTDCCTRRPSYTSRQVIVKPVNFHDSRCTHPYASV